MAYQGTSIDIAGLSIPNIFSLGSVKIKPEVLQAAESAIKLLDIRHFQNCQNLKKISDEATKIKFIENMNKQQDKLSNIAMAIDAYKVNPNSQKLEETLSKLLESDLPLPDQDIKNINNIKKGIKVDISLDTINATNVIGGKAKITGKDDVDLNASQKNIYAKGNVWGSDVEIS